MQAIHTNGLCEQGLKQILPHVQSVVKIKMSQKNHTVTVCSNIQTKVTQTELNYNYHLSISLSLFYKRKLPDQQEENQQVAGNFWILP